MSKVTASNYYQDTAHISYHMLLDFQKCEYLFSERLAGKVPRIQKDYFVYGQAFDSYLTGDFEENFNIGKKIDPAEALVKLEEQRTRSLEMIEKHAGKDSAKSQEIVSNHREKILEIAERMKEVKSLEGKESISETIYRHVLESADEFGRQELIKEFLRTKDANQVILTGTIKGLKVKGKLDWYKPKKGIVDYKTTASITRFNPFDYTGQMAWYQYLVFLKSKTWEPCYLFVVDKDVDNKHSGFWKFKQETLDAKREDLLSLVDQVKEAIESGMYTPAAQSNIQTCFTCPHYNTCPFTIQKQFYEI